jgi:cyclohexyl-isocyanide hydratase
MFRIGLLVFPMVQQLDFTAPFEVFSSWPQARVDLVWKTTEPLVSSTGLWLRPTVSFKDSPRFDVICVPGGRGVNPLLLDDEVLDFLRVQALTAKFVTSVCTGALVLGAAGLLLGKRATTHWTCIDLLPVFGAIPVYERVVFDGRLATGGGVTAGIDFALAIVGELAGAEAAMAIQLQIEYAPKPPFDAGDPSNAPRAIVEACRAQGRALRTERERLVTQAASRLGGAVANSA